MTASRIASTALAGGPAKHVSQPRSAHVAGSRRVVPPGYSCAGSRPTIPIASR